MCGRLACGLEPQEICNSCCCKEPGEDGFTTPRWINFHNLGKTYKPSYNICPTDVAPVLLSGRHFKFSSRVITPMVFGVIANVNKVASNRKYSTINCKVETVRTSKLYGNLLKKGQRCVVICSGYYEWQKHPNGKSPYFVHAEQQEGIEVDDPSSWNLQVGSGGSSIGLKPLKLAALFEIGTSNSVREKTLSFTVITKEASPELSWLHGRMPAVLETSEQVDAWLNFEEVDANLAVQYLFWKVSIVCVPVSSWVNTVTNKDIACIKEEKSSKQDDKEKSKSCLSLLQIWLEKGQKRKSEDSTGSHSEKIKKEEP